MGAFLDKPDTKKSLDSGKGNNISYGLASMQGWRIEMEDGHVARLSLPGELETWSFFGVFDGHAGAHVSALLSEHLLETILETPIFKELTASKAKHDHMTQIKSGIRDGFMAFDEYILQQNPTEKSGSTAVCVFVTPTHYIFANCGDSRAMLIRDSKPAFYTEDHKPSNALERRRINNAGGHVILSRVNGSLAVSRALGDFDYKQVKGHPAFDQLVSPEPDVTDVPRNKDLDQMLVLACDGIWDVYSNEELADYLHQRATCASSLVHICEEALDTSLFKGSRDNMTMLLIGLDQIPKEDKEAVKLDKDLDEAIRLCIESTIKNAKSGETPITTTYVANLVQDQSLPNYPPGGFVTKRALIQSICSRFKEITDCENNQGGNGLVVQSDPQ